MPAKMACPDDYIPGEASGLLMTLLDAGEVMAAMFEYTQKTIYKTERIPYGFDPIHFIGGPDFLAEALENVVGRLPTDGSVIMRMTEFIHRQDRHPDRLVTRQNVRGEPPFKSDTLVKSLNGWGFATRSLKLAEMLELVTVDGVPDRPGPKYPLFALRWMPLGMRRVLKK